MSNCFLVKCLEFFCTSWGGNDADLATDAFGEFGNIFGVSNLIKQFDVYFYERTLAVFKPCPVGSFRSCGRFYENYVLLQMTNTRPKGISLCYAILHISCM